MYCGTSKGKLIGLSLSPSLRSRLRHVWKLIQLFLQCRWMLLMDKNDFAALGFEAEGDGAEGG